MQDDRPAYLANLPPVHNTSDPEDLAWIGADGGGDPGKFIGGEGYDPETPLRLIVRAIVAANPTQTGTTSRDREEGALAALLGRGPVGRRAEPDDDLLFEIGDAYLRAFWAAPERGTSVRGKPWEPVLRPLVRAAVDRHSERWKDRNVSLESIVRLLERKFRKQRDLILARASSDTNYDRLDQLRRVRDVLVALSTLGISVSTPALPERWRRASRNQP